MMTAAVDVELLRDQGSRAVALERLQAVCPTLYKLLLDDVPEDAALLEPIICRMNDVYR